MFRIAAALLAMAPLLGACGSARLVRGDPHGGEVALDGAYTSAVPEARAVMAAHCRGRFVVVDHGAKSPTVPPDRRRVTFACVEPPPEPPTALSGKGPR